MKDVQRTFSQKGFDLKSVLNKKGGAEKKETILCIIWKLNVREIKIAGHEWSSLCACVFVCLCLSLHAFVYAQANQPDQTSASGVIKCDSAGGN